MAKRKQRSPKAGKKKDKRGGGSEDQDKAPVTKKLQEMYPWLADMHLDVKSGAIAAERQFRAEPKVTEDPDALAREYLRLSDKLATIEEALGIVEGSLVGWWAQTGLEKAEGIVVSPALPLKIFFQRVLKDLQDLVRLGEIDPIILTQVVRSVPTFDLVEFLKLTDEGTIPKDVVRRHLTGTLSVSVRDTSSQEQGEENGD